jgi:nucleoside-diphosphate-sugar epimerase
MTGATGFIGRRLAAALLQQRHTVRALVRPANTPDKRVPGGCEQVAAELLDVSGLRAVMAGADAVIYCAGSVRGRQLDDFATANVEGVRALTEALHGLEDAPPVLLLSSLAASRPQVSDYAHSKHLGEQLLKRAEGLRWTIIRPPAVYGPGDREMLPVLKMARRGLLAHAGPPEQRLSLLHVDDLVSAIMAWLQHPQNCGQGIFAIDDGTPGGYDWNDIGEAVSEGSFRTLQIPPFLLRGSASINLLLSRLFGYSPMLTPGKARELQQDEWLCDNSSFRRATGWKPRLGLRQGVQELFASD